MRLTNTQYKEASEFLRKISGFQITLAELNQLATHLQFDHDRPENRVVVVRYSTQTPLFEVFKDGESVAGFDQYNTAEALRQGLIQQIKSR